MNKVVELTAAPVRVLAAYPLAREQRGLWFLQRMAPAAGNYHLLFSLEVELGDTHPDFQQLVHQLCVDYPLLRSVFPATETGPQQQILSHISPDIRRHQAIGWDDERLREQARLDSRRPFDLEQAPLWRVHLYERGNGRWLAVLVAHHLLLDFWSLGLLLQDIASRLGIAESAMELDGEGFCLRSLAQAAPNTAQEQGWRDYWCSQLQGAAPVHSLPLDYPRPKQQQHSGRSLAFQLDKHTSEAIKSLARAQAVTPYMALLSLWTLSLHQLCGECDWVIATPVAGRTSRSERNQLGQFVNTLALRIGIDDEQSFNDLLQQVRGQVIGGLKQQDCPFPWLVEQLAPQRDPSVAPLTQIGFSWERLPLLADYEAFFLPNPPPLVRQAAGMLLSPFAIPQQEGQLELQLEMGGEIDGALVGQLKYQPQLFAAETAQRLVDNLQRWCKAAVAAPTQPLKHLTALDPDSSAALLALGSGADRQWPVQHSLELIAAQVRNQPSAIAISDDKGAISYAQLWSQARAIATLLADRGVQEGDHIGLFLHRHSGVVAAILGCWMAGAAYVPLDPAFPADRLAYIAADAGLCQLLTESSLLAELPIDLPYLCVDAELAQCDDFAPRSGTSAYLLYTSGSTGQPKGVRVGHRSVHNFLAAMAELLGWGADTHLLAITTTAFDISVLELLLPLATGGRLTIANSQTLRAGDALRELLARSQCNAMQATPASWKMLLDAGWQGATPFGARFSALCGGETLSSDLAEQLLARCSSLWNVYGPTETTVWSSAAQVTNSAQIHLGRPLANTRFYVLDQHQRLAAPGALGELWIGGEGLALDYWQRPELSASRFTCLPGLPAAGRLYRTGDRVRWNAAGELEHQGRLDFQVKLRGYRIELGEIEQLLKQQAGVKDALVMVRSERADDPRLVAYLVGDAATLDTQLLQRALATQLPAYMLPSAWQVLEAFPETPNRKIDRNALPAPDYNQGNSQYRAPADALEIQLAGLFSEVLGISQVGADDDFFALGGHSLLAVQLVSAIQRLTGTELAIGELLQHATVAGLAQRLRGQVKGSDGISVTLRAGRDSQPLWLFHPIGGNVFCYLELSRQLNPRRPLIALQSPGLADADAAEVSIEAMASQYLKVLRAQQPSGPYLLGGWCFGGTLAFAVARQLQAEGEQIEGVVLIDTRAPIAANVPSDADDATLLSWFARDLATPYGKSLRIDPETLRALPAAAMFGHVLDQAKALGVLPLDADVAALERYFQVYIGNGIALRLYFPEPGDLPLLLLLARDEPEDYGPLLGWDSLCQGPLEQRSLAGDHNSIMYAPQASSVAIAIDQHFPIKPLKGFVA